jgi:hypothetical protein
MGVRTILWKQVPGPIRRRIDDRLRRFSEWKRHRPFWGAFLLMLGGFVIGWLPIQFATELAVIGGAFTVIGLIFAVMVFLTGAFVMAKPELSTIFGVIGIALSILSLIGALGGFLIGMLLGIIGGNLCIAWRDPNPQARGSTTSSTDEVQFSWQGDQ